MSDEEKKAWDNLIMLKYFTMEKEDKQAIDTILNLIEKQQKEIEELKTNKGYHIGFIDGGIAKRYEYEDKIKAKIEEYERLSNNITIQPQIYPYIIEVLHSLLEKE